MLNSTPNRLSWFVNCMFELQGALLIWFIKLKNLPLYCFISNSVKGINNCPLQLLTNAPYLRSGVSTQQGSVGSHMSGSIHWSLTGLTGPCLIHSRIQSFAWLMSGKHAVVMVWMPPTLEIMLNLLCNFSPRKHTGNRKINS